LFVNCIHHACDGRTLSDIALDGDDAAAAEFIDLVADALRTINQEVHGRDARALCGKAADYRGGDPTACSCDHHHTLRLHRRLQKCCSKGSRVEKGGSLINLDHWST
jgi:hypothetical protein